MFCTFWLPIAPQRPALFRHLNFQKWSGREVFLAFFTSKCASRHNSVQFFISHPASWLRTRRFSEPTFQPSGATNHWKNTVFRDFPTFSRTWIFFPLKLSLFWSSFFFSSLLFSDSSHLCFSSVHTVGSLTSKLPSIFSYHQISSTIINYPQHQISSTIRKYHQLASVIMIYHLMNHQIKSHHAFQGTNFPRTTWLSNAHPLELCSLAGKNLSWNWCSACPTKTWLIHHW